MNTVKLTMAIAEYSLSSCLITRLGELVYQYEQTPGIAGQMMPINSCTKSILSALICIAMDQGTLSSEHTLAHHYFPQLRNDPDERKQQITLLHLLTMTPGFRWQEFGGLNSFPTMSRSANWIRYVLELPLADAPGTRMVYNSGASQLLAHVLAQAVEGSIADFARRYLFEALGIDAFEWPQDPAGVHTGGFGLRMRARDLLAFGELYLNRGLLRDQQIISAGRIASSIVPAIAATSPDRGAYSWHWWNDTLPAGHVGQAAPLSYYYARGFGGQFVFVVPERDTVVVMTRKQHHKKLFPLDLFRDHIAAVL